LTIIILFLILKIAFVAKATNNLGEYEIISKTNWNTSEFLKYCGGLYSVLKKLIFKNTFKKN
jgi:hypothetical protein